MFRFARCLAFVSLVALAAGCGSNGDSTPGPSGGEKPKPKADPSVQVEGKKLMLAAEPAGVKGVIAVRQEAKDGDEVIVAGQVGGSAKPFTEGRASFLLVDPTLKPTDECDCPWDFCGTSKKDLAAARLSVKFVDAEGKTLKNGARELFGIKELSGVVVKGKVSRDDEGNVIVVASGLFVRPEQK